MSDRDRAILPDTLPIFPLTGVLLLPRGRLPLNIFEPRYLAMTRDALGGERLIGMVQPNEPQQDNRGGGAMNPPVYPIGCAGRITSFTETDDGRYLLTLTGAEFDRDRFIRGLKGFFTQRQISADWEAIEKAVGEHLINSIAMLCPFAPSEKQALLEAPDLDERARLLIALVEMAAVDPGQNFASDENGATRH